MHSPTADDLDRPRKRLTVRRQLDEELQGIPALLAIIHHFGCELAVLRADDPDLHLSASKFECRPNDTAQTSSPFGGLQAVAPLRVRPIRSSRWEDLPFWCADWRSSGSYPGCSSGGTDASAAQNAVPANEGESPSSLPSVAESEPSDSTPAGSEPDAIQPGELMRLDVIDCDSTCEKHLIVLENGSFRIRYGNGTSKAGQFSAEDLTGLRTNIADAKLDQLRRDVARSCDAADENFWTLVHYQFIVDGAVQQIDACGPAPGRSPLLAKAQILVAEAALN